MKNKIWILLVFSLLIFVQWMFPIQMILRQENILTSGTEYKFRIAPSYQDAGLGGKFLNLQFIDLQNFSTSDTSFTLFENVYLIIATDSGGYAKIQSIVHNKPASENDFVPARVASLYNDENPLNRLLSFEVGFQQYFLEESKLSIENLEILRQEAQSSQQAYALVKILKGSAAIESIVVDGKIIGPSPE